MRATRPLDKRTIDARRSINLRQEHGHWLAGFLRELLEACKDLARYDLLASAGAEPVIQKDRRARVAQPSYCDFRFPECRLEVHPVLQVRLFYIGTRFR